MATDEDYQWLRPASTGESIMDASQKKNFILTSYVLTLSSAAPLQDDHVRKALIHLYRKVPTLRLCFRHRGETLWACQMDREEIDFKVIEFTDPLRVAEDAVAEGYDSARGPLWRARLLKEKDGGGTAPELEAAFPYTRHLVFGNHHGIADGTSNLTVTDLLLRLLDDVIAGRAVDDAEQLGGCDGGEETERLVSAVEAELRRDPEALRALLEEEERRGGEPTLTVQAFPPKSDGAGARTRVVTKDLDRDATGDFLKRCKDEGVTVHCAFTALLNGTLVDVLEEAGVKREAYRFKELHTVNMRRYWPKGTTTTPPALGCHVGLLQNQVETSSQWRDDFWQYARAIHQNLHRNIKERSPVKDSFVQLNLLGDDMDAVFSEELIPEHEYITANLRNVDWLVPTEGEHVRMTHLVRATSNWKDCWVHMFHTLRGRFMYCLCYSDHIISEQTARRFVDTLFKNLKSVV